MENTQVQHTHDTSNVNHPDHWVCSDKITYGSISFYRGGELISASLSQEPYIALSNDLSRSIYEAHAIGDDGIEYRIVWEIKPDDEYDPEVQDESDACDWDCFTVHRC